MDKFNSDLLQNDGDKAFLREICPDIAEMLIWDALRASFDAHEKLDVRDKYLSAKYITIGIGLIVMSLLVTLATTTPIIRVHVAANPDLGRVIAIVAISVLIFGALLARGVIMGNSRDTWLRHRIVAERLRQLNFQVLAANVNLICDTSVRAQAQLEQNKRDALRDFKFSADQGSYIQSVIDDTSLDRASLAQLDVKKDAVIDHERWKQFKRYYEKLRLDWQEQYARSFFAQRGGFLRQSSTSIDKYFALKTVQMFATVGLFLFQIVAVLLLFFVPSQPEVSQWFAIGASASTVVIFGTSALRDTTALTGELTRYRHYLSHIEKARRMFSCEDAATCSADAMRAVREMEDAAYFEMREFLLLRKKVDLSF